MLNLRNLLVKFLPGFVPLILFVIAESIWGIKIGLYIAVAFGITQFIFVYIKQKKADFFVLADTSLLIVLGVVSLLLNNESYFKLKPAMIESVFAVMIALSLFSKYDLMVQMSKRYLNDIRLTEGQMKEFRRNLKVMLLIFIIHIAAIIYAAYFMSDEAWAFISSAALYIMFGAYLLFQFLRYRVIKNKMKLIEWLPMVDAKGGVKGRVPRDQAHGQNKIMHPVIHLHVVKENSIYLQKRPYDKLVQPGKWDTAVGGHLSFGESIEDGLRREANEELGLINFKPHFLLKYVWETDIEKELVYCFITKEFDQITVNKEELEDGKFWPINQIRENIGKGVFTPNFEKEFDLLENICFAKA